MIINDVPGGLVCRGDLFDGGDVECLCEQIENAGSNAVAIADPPYGGIVSDYWDRVSGEELADLLKDLALKLGHSMPNGSHLCIWGGIGKPGDRAFYRMVPKIEEATSWQMAEHITWEKKRGYGIQWRCLFAREECARFVLGDIKRPTVFHVQHTEEPQTLQMGKTPTRKPFKRMTSIWRHASDMSKKLHQCYKPPELARTLIQMCTNPGDLVLDLFAGSGEVSVQARDMGRPFIAVENDSDTFDSLTERLRGIR